MKNYLLYFSLVAAISCDTNRNTNLDEDQGSEREVMTSDATKDYGATSDALPIDSQTGSRCDECSIENIRNIRSTDPQREHVKIFLQCFNEECFKNVEYGQAANYSLFLIISNNPSLLLSVSNEYSSSLDSVFIYKQLANPVSDDIDIEKVIGALRTVEKGDNEFHGSLEAALIEALSKL